MINSSNICTCDAYDTKSFSHNVNNENNEVQHKQKRFSWNFRIKFNFGKNNKICHEWLPQDIALVFIQN